MRFQKGWSTIRGVMIVARLRGGGENLDIIVEGGGLAVWLQGLEKHAEKVPLVTDELSQRGRMFKRLS
jgi:hypothetical protein